MTILPRINGTPGFGFAEAITRSDGSVERFGALEFRVSDADELRAAIESGEPLTYTGPVCVDGVWVEQSFLVTVTPVAPGWDSSITFSIAECGAPEMQSAFAQSDAA